MPSLESTAVGAFPMEPTMSATIYLMRDYERHWHTPGPDDGLSAVIIILPFIMTAEQALRAGPYELVGDERVAELEKKLRRATQKADKRRIVHSRTVPITSLP